MERVERNQKLHFVLLLPKKNFVMAGICDSHVGTMSQKAGYALT